jgi:hypothetical protein
MSGDEEDIEIEEKVEPRVKVPTSFPQLHYGASAIGTDRFVSNPPLSQVSRLGRQLAKVIKKDRADMSKERLGEMVDKCHKTVIGARQRYAKTTQSVLKGEPSANLLNTYEMLLTYLVSGKSTHINDVGKCLEMISFAKSYNLCSDALVSLVLDTLKSLVAPQNVVKIIIAVGSDLQDDAGKTYFHSGDEFFLRYAIDNGHQVFGNVTEAAELYNGHLVASRLVKKYPTIAVKFLTLMPALFWEKTKPPEPSGEEDEEDE